MSRQQQPIQLRELAQRAPQHLTATPAANANVKETRNKSSDEENNPSIGAKSGSRSRCVAQFSFPEYYSLPFSPTPQYGRDVPAGSLRPSEDEVTEEDVAATRQSTHRPEKLQQQPQRISRLPPNTVARKAPRKGGPAASPPAGIFTKTSVIKEAPRRIGSKQESYPQPDVRRKDALEHALARNTPTQSIPRALKQQNHKEDTPARTLTKRRSRVVLEDDEEQDISMQDVARPSIEWSSVHQNPETGIEKAESSERAGSHILHQNPVPTELRTLQSALGYDNWNEYVLALVEKYQGTISEMEYTRRTKPLFLMYDERLRKRMDREVTQRMIKPQLAHAVRESDHA